MGDRENWLEGEDLSMLYPLSNMYGYTIGAADGDIGSVADVYFDGHVWTVRYLVVDTGRWLSGRRVLVSPRSVRGVDPSERRIHVALTQKQIEDGPPWETHRPVSRQEEIEYGQYYGYPPYWDGPYSWGSGYTPYMTLPVPPAPNPVEEEVLARARQEREDADPNLQSARDVTGCHIQALDDDIGHTEDFLVDDQTWAIRYMVVDTRNWLPGKKVLIAPSWISRVSWADSRVYVDVLRGRIEGAPEYDPSRPLVREHEARLYEHYGRRKYWEDENKIVS
jgi:PRC-barrel domain